MYGCIHAVHVRVCVCVRACVRACVYGWVGVGVCIDSVCSVVQVEWPQPDKDNVVHQDW